MRFFALLMLFCASIFLVSCVNHKNAYLKEDAQISPLVVPTDVPVIKQAPYYPIPAIETHSVGKKPVSLLPPTLSQ